MLLAITSIARYTASCWERLTRSEFSIGLPDPFWSVVPSVLQPPCHREMPDFIGFYAQRMTVHGNSCRSQAALPGNLNHSLTTFA
jgi:hypothetical protein